MIFTEIPKNGASYLEPLIYGFDCGSPEDEVVVRILTSDGQLIGSKRLYGEVVSATIDIAPYLRQMAPPWPIEQPERSAVVDAEYNIDVAVEVMGQMSEMRRFVAAKVDGQAEVALLSEQMKHRTIAYDEFDTIGLMTSSESPLEVVIEAYDKSSLMAHLSFEAEGVGQKVIYVCPKDFAPGVKGLKLLIYCGSQMIDVVEYEVRENIVTAERIGWLNEHLAPEHYTFPLRKSLLVEATRRQMENIWGKEAAALEQKNELKLISSYEPQVQLKALARILSAPKVWLQRAGKTEVVELSTERVLITPTEGIGFIELDLQAAEKGVLLW